VHTILGYHHTTIKGVEAVLNYRRIYLGGNILRVHISVKMMPSNFYGSQAENKKFKTG
jgi:hypothetical protein